MEAGLRAGNRTRVLVTSLSRVPGGMDGRWVPDAGMSVLVGFTLLFLVRFVVSRISRMAVK